MQYTKLFTREYVMDSTRIRQITRHTNKIRNTFIPFTLQNRIQIIQERTTSFSVVYENISDSMYLY